MRRIALVRLGRVLCLALFSLAVIPSEHPRAQVPAPPNILLIVTDDQPVHSEGVMPETVRLIRDSGVDFKQAMVSTPLCCPSRASIMTGRYPHNHGVRQQNGLALDQSTTIQRYLHDAGYLTAAIGKFLNQGRDSSADPLRPEYFDRWSIIKTNNLPYEGFPVNDMGEIRTEPSYSTTFVADRTVDFLTEFDQLDDDGPWFAWVGFQAPHHPSQPEEKYQRARVPTWRSPPSVGEEDRTDKPPWVLSRDVSISESAARRTEMFRSLMSVDDQVQKLIDTLASLGELDNTIVVFTSDNGYLFGDHGVRGKRFPYRNSIRVPLYVRWSSRLPAGTVNTNLVSNIDLAPMFLEAAGLSEPIDPPMDGRSLLTNPPRERLHIEYFYDVGNVPTWRATLRNDSYYIASYDETGARIFEEFYRVEEDPWMLDNVLLSDVEGTAPGPETLLQLQLELEIDQMCAGPTCP